MHLFLVLNTNLEYLSELCTVSYCHRTLWRYTNAVLLLLLL